MVGKRLNVQIRTKLPVRDCASLFEQSMKVSWMSNFKGQGTQFRKPPADDAFGDLDDDPPTFSVMATLGGGGSEAQATDVVLLAWDRGDGRELQVMDGKALLSLGMKSKGKVKKFIAALQAADPSVEYAGI
jgi:hypothetical protein